jgi:hypothetical protein
MAKRKAETPPPDEPDKDDRATILNLKGTREYKDWLDSLSDFSHMPAATLFDVAIAEYSKRVGFPRPAPKRTGGKR